MKEPGAQSRDPRARLSLLLTCRFSHEEHETVTQTVSASGAERVASQQELTMALPSLQSKLPCSAVTWEVLSCPLSPKSV